MKYPNKPAVLLWLSWAAVSRALSVGRCSPARTVRVLSDALTPRPCHCVSADTPPRAPPPGTAHATGRTGRGGAWRVAATDATSERVCVCAV